MRKWFPIALIITALPLLISCEPLPPPIEIADDLIHTAINQLMQYEGVVDTTIEQEGRDVSLVIIADYETSEEYAKHLGETLIRLIKKSSKDKIPLTQIGPGIYNYYVSVIDPNKERIIFGAKVTTAWEITWVK